MWRIVTGLVAASLLFAVPTTIAWARMITYQTAQSSVQAGSPTLAPDQKTFTVPDVVVVAVNGTPMGIAKQSAIVVYRAPHSAGGYDAYVAFSTQAASIGWWTDKNRADGTGGLHIKIQLLNSAQAAMAEVDLDKSDVLCRDTARFFMSKKTIDPDLFNLIAGARVIVLESHRWMSCKG